MKTLKIVLLLILFAVVLAACALNGNYHLPAIHPPEAELGKRPPICVDCHEGKDETFNWEQFNHTGIFVENHRQQGYRNSQVCSMCHQRNFCNDCHANKLDLKPSLKNQSDTYREMPHRGDYISRHRIDARVDPTSCFRCHGNPKTTKTCAPCHGS